MKKIYKILSLLTILTSSALFAQNDVINFTFSGGYFYSADGTQLTSGKVLLVADTNSSGLSGIKLENGSSLNTGNYLNGGTDYYVFASANINSTGPMTGQAQISIELELTNLIKGKDYAIVILGDTLAEGVATAGDAYGVFAPSFVTDSVDPLSGGDEWTIPSAFVDYYAGKLFTSGFVGDIPDSYTKTDKVVSNVPEPSTYALIFGMFTLAFVALKRRK